MFYLPKYASVPNGGVTGGRDSKEDIARRNADKPVVCASNMYLHSLRIIGCDIPSLFGTTRLLYVLYTPLYITAVRCVTRFRW